MKKKKAEKKSKARARIIKRLEKSRKSLGKSGNRKLRKTEKIKKSGIKKINNLFPERDRRALLELFA